MCDNRWRRFSHPAEERVLATVRDDRAREVTCDSDMVGRQGVCGCVCGCGCVQRQGSMAELQVARLVRAC